jgi:tartrate dehydrogenase/decarboxylase/D-malate dehydrogenase
MLDDPGETAAGEQVLQALEAVCSDGLLTRDLGGSASSSDRADAIVAQTDQEREDV